MIKEAINRILELAAPEIIEIDGENYCDRKLTRIDKELRANEICMSTLSSFVAFIQNSGDLNKGKKYIVQVVSPTEVRLISELDADRRRETLAIAGANVPEFDFGRQIPHKQFLINVQSKFCDGDPAENDKALILKFAGTVKSGTVTDYKDDGVSQKATIKTGVASLSEAEVPSPCVLIPYRTFVEVEQPSSEFIFRLDEGSHGDVTCALYEADGGAWKNEAIKNIAAYLMKELAGNDNITVIS